MEQFQRRYGTAGSRLPCPAYRGKEPYMFISYAHADAEKVFAEIRRFNEAGFHVWYDEGIAPGKEWTDEIADALSGCALFVFMVTPVSVQRENVVNEVNYALDEGKPVLAIHLAETVLRGGLKLRIGSRQAVLKYSMTEKEYTDKVSEAFVRFGLKAERTADPHAGQENREAVSISRLDALAARMAKMHEKKEAAPPGRQTVTDGFLIDGGLLKGYAGDKRDLVLPPSVTVLSAASFQNCREFIESVDLNNVSIATAGTFTDCPKLHTVRASKNLKPVSPHVFQNCPEVTLYIRHDQVSEGFAEGFTGKAIVFTDER